MERSHAIKSIPGMQDQQWLDSALSLTEREVTEGAEIRVL